MDSIFQIRTSSQTYTRNYQTEVSLLIKLIRESTSSIAPGVWIRTFRMENMFFYCATNSRFGKSGLPSSLYPDVSPVTASRADNLEGKQWICH